MGKELLHMLITATLAMISEENLKKLADMVLDLAENKVEATENKIDDAIILPLCKKVRTIFDIPDNDE